MSYGKPHYYKEKLDVAQLKIDALDAALDEAITGLRWYSDTYPESDSQADDEFLERAEAARNM